ncbi:hypothetical protein [Bradyrhizobium sp. CCBAU 51627]|uniref:hypothetical protein n=1 Tax=Bradyrhizobium sp. CCBAU 51627 TaxID=1325088 RepID=UPI002305AAD2|nr:hypothetical protein [Bradyrhizobium sp. CCBAU 51627]
MNKFARWLSSECASTLQALSRSATDNWWKEVLTSPELFLALRGGYLNAYVKGQSVFKIGLERGNGLDQNGAPRVSIHYKYLVQPDLGEQDPYIRFDGLQFAVKPTDVVQTAYRPNITLSRLIKTASRFSGPEKTGVHEIAMKEGKVIDLEIAFSQSSNEGSSAPRMDLAVLIPNGPSHASLVFCEAKCADNPELSRLEKKDKKNESALRRISVVAQIEKYKKYISDDGNKENLIASYVKVCEMLTDLHSQGLARTPDPLIARVAKGEAALSIHPHVYLLVYDFTAEQRDGALGKQLELLRADDKLGNRIIAKGDAAHFTLAQDIQRLEDFNSGKHAGVV